MAPIVLVHGGSVSTDTWNTLAGRTVYPPGKLLGGRVWDSIIPALRSHHHTVYAPTLEDEHHSTLTGHIEQVCRVIAGHRLTGVILAGHSYGGMVITGAATRMPDRIRHLVYVDAALPDPGQSLFDLLVAGGHDPESVDGLELAAPYTEHLQYDPTILDRLHKTYILCTESEFASVTRVAKQKIASSRERWTYEELPTGHLPMATMPRQLSDLLRNTAGLDMD